MKIQTTKLVFLVCTLAFIALVTLLPRSTPPSRALPVYARKYDVTCNACHTIPSKLNKNGLAFEANYFNWPGGPPPHLSTGWRRVPLSGFITNSWSSGQGAETIAQFDTAELFATDGFNSNGGHGGGYWIDYLAAENNTGDRPGDLDGAWVAVPIAGNRGQFALKVGQISPVTYQFDGNTDLMSTLPSALDDPLDNISFDENTPGVNLEYFDNRGEKTPSGNYVEVGVPFGGHLSLNKDSRLYSAQGAYIHAFQRQGYNTYGVLAFRNGNANLEGVIVTRQITPQLSTMAIGTTGGDINGNQQHLTAQADYVLNKNLAFSAEYNIIRGVVHDDFPVATVTWYPFNQKVIRISGETVQDKGARSNTIYALVQL